MNDKIHHVNLTDRNKYLHDTAVKRYAQAQTCSKKEWENLKNSIFCFC